MKKHFTFFAVAVGTVVVVAAVVDVVASSLSSFSISIFLHTRERERDFFFNNLEKDDENDAVTYRHNSLPSFL
jgi:hypothetical protein